MRETNILGDYQEDGMGSGPERDDGVNERMRAERQQVLEVLEMPGYAILHKMFIETISEATKRLQNRNLSESELRYEQGVVGAITRVQSAFVHYNEEADSDSTEEDGYERERY